TQVFLRPLERLAIFDADPVPRLKIEKTRNPNPALALHPGSGSEKKNWPELKWAELIRVLLSDCERNIVLVGGEAEEGRLERLAKTAPVGRVEILRSRPLPELARRLANCRGFIGHDSGITHLAAAAGVPVLALWGETVEEVWRPMGERVTLIRSGAALTDIPVETVSRAVQEAFTD